MTSLRTIRSRHSDTGQSALVMVLAVTIILTLTAGVLVGVTVNNDPLVQSASVQRYAYRALESGLNAYQSALNADPCLATCNANSTAPDCSPLKYVSWSQVGGTQTGNGVVPEYYKIDNPQQILDSTTNAIDYVEVQVVGAAGYPNDLVYQSTIAKFVPTNGFLNHVWWSNYESFDSSANGSAANCQYYYSKPTNPNAVIAGGVYANYGVNSTTGDVGTSTCGPVYFGPNDTILGPLYSNDSLFVSGKPDFGTNSGVQTPDPNCLFVDLPSYSGPSTCAGTAAAEVGTYSPSLSTYGVLPEKPPSTQSTDAVLSTLAQQGGCYYQGPTTVTMLSAGTMQVTSPDTNVVNSGCSLAGTTSSLPKNGVLFVDSGASNPVAGANPFDGTTQTTTTTTKTTITTQNTSTVTVKSCYVNNPTKCTTTGPTTSNVGNPSVVGPTTGSSNATALIDPQTQATCSGCYYGQTANPDAEADAFVSGSLSGQLTIAAANNVIIDGSVTYHDCTWATPSITSESLCGYNNTAAADPINDTLGLIANNYVEIDHPLVAGGGDIQNCVTVSSPGSPSTNTSTTTTTGTPGVVNSQTGTGNNKQNVTTTTTPGSVITTAVTTTVSTSATFAPPMCDASTPTGSATGGQGLTVDATLLADSESFVVNNYQTKNSGITFGGLTGPEGVLNVYGSISQDARGPVGNFGGTPANIVNGYSKYYLWDPRLTLYAPPYYQTPGTSSWALDSSAVNYATSCPSVPDPDPVPSANPVTTSTACTAP